VRERQRTRPAPRLGLDRRYSWLLSLVGGRTAPPNVVVEGEASLNLREGDEDGGKDGEACSCSFEWARGCTVGCLMAWAKQCLQ
jgi:hypothetical protein